MNCPPSLDPSLDVKTNIWNPNVLVLDISCGPTDNDLRTFVDSLPLVNRALRTIFISEIVDGEMLLRYPGALLSVGMPAPPPPPPPGMPQVCWPTARTDLTVSIPEVTARDANGVETIRWVPVLAEVRSDPASGPFSFNSMGPQKGIAAVAINYPFQSAALSGFRKGKFDEQGNPCTNGYDANGAPCANVAEVIAADDAGVTDLTGPPAGTALQAQTSNTNTTYKGQYGLGNQLAFAKTVRPYRSLLLGQAMFRREVIQ
jgi:hypothetical protein